MTKLVMTKGLSGSGKSTFAKELCAGDQTYRRVNKDILREMRIGDEKFTPAKERDVVIMRNVLVGNYLSRGLNVVVDDTNLAPVHETVLRQIAEEHGAEFSVASFLHVSLEECIKRDAQRTKPLGEQIIRKQWLQTLPPAPAYQPDLMECIIVDIDGTLADISHRGPYETRHEILMKDRIRQHVALTVNALQFAEHVHVMVFSGRSEVTRDVTHSWLDKHLNEFELHMRAEGDNRRDSLVKREMYDREVKDKYNVVAVFDDRPQVLEEVWYALGLPVFNCGLGVRF